MPIRPENRGLYPADWKAISLATKERAGWRCQGSPAYPECRRPHNAIGYRRDDGTFRVVEQLRRDSPPAESRQALADHSYAFGDVAKLIRVILTVGHFDHNPANCDPGNLFAWCQRCHLFHDRDHHAATRARTRRERADTGDLFGELGLL